MMNNLWQMQYHQKSTLNSNYVSQNVYDNTCKKKMRGFMGKY